ncbi:hypothetical protein H2248_011482 [Termitomyces sp. 'cryptogamus']|nr:hypothetical protein H2248_011482 [Termitomyces sp. 'cryptogamus']
MTWYDVEDAEGEPVNSTKVNQVHADARHIWATLQDKSRVPATWAKADLGAINFYEYHLSICHPGIIITLLGQHHISIVAPKLKESSQARKKTQRSPSPENQHTDLDTSPKIAHPRSSRIRPNSRSNVFADPTNIASTKTPRKADPAPNPSSSSHLSLALTTSTSNTSHSATSLMSSSIPKPLSSSSSQLAVPSPLPVPTTLDDSVTDSELMPVPIMPPNASSI